MSESDSVQNEVIVDPNIVPEPKTISKTGKRVGRPPKALVAKKKEKRAVGRPKGDNSAIQDFKARLLASPKSRKVLDSILDAALDDEHKNQAAAWKLLMDRMLPISYFDKEKAGGGKASVNITITGVNGETTIVGTEDNIIDGEYEDYDS